MSEFSLLTFDCYGTLIDWELGMREALEGLTRKKNISLDIQSSIERYVEVELEIEQGGYRKYKEVLALGVGKLFKEKGIELTPEEETIFADTIVKWPPFPETTEVLKNLKERYKLAILSNIDDDIIRDSVSLMGVEFDAVITAEQVKSYKPSHGHWKRMLESFDIPKERILHVAASYVHDVIPAKELGFTVAWINRKGEKITGNAKPDYEFKDLRPLITI